MAVWIALFAVFIALIPALIAANKAHKDAGAGDGGSSADGGGGSDCSSDSGGGDCGAD